MTGTLKPLLPYTGVSQPTSVVWTDDDFFLLYDDLGSAATIMSLSVDPSTYAVTQIDTGSISNVDKDPGEGTLSIDPVNRRALVYARNSTSTPHTYAYYTYDASGNLTEQVDGSSGVTAGSNDLWFTSVYSSTYDRFFVFWVDAGDGSDLTYTYGTPGASSITWNTSPITAKAGTMNIRTSVVQVGGDTVVAAYIDGTSLEIMAGTQSTTTITWGTAVSVGTSVGTASVQSVATDDSNVYISSYDGTQMYVKKYSISGTTLTLVSTVNFPTPYAVDSSVGGLKLQYDTINDLIVGSFIYTSSSITQLSLYVIPSDMSGVRIFPGPQEGVGANRFGAIGAYDDGTGVVTLGRNIEGDSNDQFIMPYELEVITSGGTAGLTGSEDLFLLKGKTRAYDLA
jgi:YD repeat-containing protein